MHIDEIKNIYFIGIGGIGMSALARYFFKIGKNIAGYDKTPTQLTFELQQEGMNIHFMDDSNQIPEKFKNQQETLIIITPAIPCEHAELIYFQKNQFEIKKRAEALGLISENFKTIGIAGTHGKTTISTLTAWIISNSRLKCNAFLGGISKNFNSNFVLQENTEFAVIEADEYDRSFLQLRPLIAVISYIDTDHLDIYGSFDEIKNAFIKYIYQIKPGGSLIIKEDIKLLLPADQSYYTYTYSLDSANSDFFAKNIRIKNNFYHFDLITPSSIISDLVLGIPGLLNVENAIAASAASIIAGAEEIDIRESLKSFAGIQRRFDIQINNEKLIYIDDYAHHPKEIEATIKSIKQFYPGKKITGIFQPHLYSRTKDLADEFATSLSLLDELILFEIYPARELPIEGVSSELILNKVTLSDKSTCNKEQLFEVLKDKKLEIVLTIGAGDIGTMVESIKNYLLEI